MPETIHIHAIDTVSVERFLCSFPELSQDSL
jgi:hypothetical protein